MKTKVNVNIGTSTLKIDLDEEIEKAKVAVKYHADTIMDLSDGGDVGMIRRALLDVPHQLLLEQFQFMRRIIMVLKNTKIHLISLRMITLMLLKTM